MVRFRQELRDGGNDRKRRFRIVGMAGAGAQVAEAPPDGPVRAQQAPRIAGADQVGEGEGFDFVRIGRGVLQATLEGAVGKFIGELEALDQTVADLFVRGVLLYTGQEVLPFGERIWAMPVESLWRLGAVPQEAA